MADDAKRLTSLRRKARRYAQEHGYAPSDEALREEQREELADDETVEAIDLTLKAFHGTGLENL